MVFDPRNVKPPQEEDDPLTREVIGLGIEVHRQLGPGLLESVYEKCLCWELRQASFNIEQQVFVPLIYKGIHLDSGFRMDIVVNGELVIELKSTDKILPIHSAQLLTYMKLSQIPKGLILNINTPILKQGIKRHKLFF